MILLNLIKVIRFTFLFLKTQNNFNDTFIDSYLNVFYKKHRKELKESTILKIKKYYCLASPLTSLTYKKISGRALSPIELEMSILMGIIVPLVDDFTDDNSLDSESIDRLLFSNSDYEPKTLEEDIVMSINRFFLENVKSTDGFLDTLKKGINAQHCSIKQMDSDVSRDELQMITLEKGGWGMVLWHYIIDEVPTPQTIQMIYLMGGIEQMCNDIFDVYKDYKEGIATYANTCDDYRALEEYYKMKSREFVKLVRELPYKKNDLNFFISFHSLIIARGIVALRMLSKLQIRLGGGILPFGKLDRKKLICDMEKPINIFRMVKFANNILSVKPSA
jgi:hypothetical protein